MSVVLVVDDDPIVRNSLCRALRQEGHEAVPASDPAEAATRLDERLPDVVVVDVNPDGPAGGRLPDAVCREPRWRAVPVVLLTSEADARGPHCAGPRRAGSVRAASSLREVMGCVRSAAAAPT
jgi:two-component system chemotaxis response regulator CheY